ncbi:hypothetical protein J2S43_001988 [Catenuloplanes nepalensis]|uniref:ABC transporter permease n=1 Tax=Catenuloplanes nepalensis TaxID=587533 RepID=A0ABT9MR16_9ACTN|nr:hypothetical protein [Catenuloplanes nepalensis]MDP9793476.1 hypothetical protein [Catenuloplanes nepalensis]
MTIRLTLLELRRTWLPWLVAAMLFASWTMTSDGMDPRWPGLVNATVLGHRAALALLWPLALTIGVWIGRRDGAAGTAELVDVTPRRPRSRLALRAALLGTGLAAVYLAALAETIGLAVLDADTYWPSGWPWSLLTGALGIAAAGLLGLALGRRLPSLWTVPLTLVLSSALIFALEIVTRDRRAGALALLPSYLPDDGTAGEFLRISAATVAGQTIWFVALGAAGFLFYALPSRHRPAALLPGAAVLAAGLAGALLVLPPAARATTVDAGATALVCAEGTPRVCVTRAYEKTLPELTGPAREALAALSRLPDAPSALIQDEHAFGVKTIQDPATVRVRLTVDGTGALVTGGPTLVEDLLDGAGTLRCEDYTTQRADTRQRAARAVAAFWLLHRTEPPPSYMDDERVATAQAWDALHALPEAEQVTRVVALREAGLQCRADLFEILTGAA